MRKILIVGSCVSRDALEFLEPEKYMLTAYHARSSLAVLTSPVVPSKYSTALKKIPSAFQKRMVEYDFNKSILKNIADLSYDILLIDLIDERFHLAVFENKYRVTRSTEFLKTELKPNSLINAHSEEFMQLWYEGVNLILKSLSDKGGLYKLRVQKAYWSNKLDNGLSIDKYSDEMVKKENDKLESMYSYLEKFLNSSQFISMPKDLYIVKSNHKWGVSPFHYIDDYYKYLVENI